MFWGQRLCRNRLSPVVDCWRLSTLTGSLSSVRNSLPWLEKPGIREELQAWPSQDWSLDARVRHRLILLAALHRAPQVRDVGDTAGAQELTPGETRSGFHSWARCTKI